MVCTFARLFVGGVVVCSAAPQTRGFLRTNGGMSRLIDASELEVSLRESLEGAMGSGTWAVRATEIERKMAKTFQALPKNENGRLAPAAVKYITHNYFQKEHGWLISGLEPTEIRANSTELHSASILQNKAPSILEAILEDRQANRGLALHDAVALIASLEHLIFDESVLLLERAYQDNKFQTGDMLDEAGLHAVLRSYLLLFRQGELEKIDGDLDPAAWDEIVAYEQDAQHAYDYNARMKVNPFVERRYSFEEASQMVINLAEGYGQWQNADCRDMKEHLMKLDIAGTGRIPLDTFYRSDAGPAYEFTESREYLREAGALDESLKSNPSVLIANYLLGPSNCIASNSYFSVCCLSECEHLMNEIESHVQGPTGTSQQLLSVLSNMSSSTVDAPRSFSPTMVSRLDQISGQNGGIIPLHGRLFGQWLHYAFPHECPLPVAVQNARTPSAWLSGAAFSTTEEREQHIQAADHLKVSGEQMVGQWTEEEILPFDNLPVKQTNSITSLLRFVMMGTSILFVLKIACESLQAAVHAHQGSAGEWKDKKGALPI